MDEETRSLILEMVDDLMTEVQDTKQALAEKIGEDKEKVEAAAAALVRMLLERLGGEKV